MEPVAHISNTAVGIKPDVKTAKSESPLPEGYVSAEEFNKIFEQKIRAAYAKL